VTIEDAIAAAVRREIEPLARELTALRAKLEQLTAPTTIDRQLTIVEAARLAGVKPRTMRAWLDQGRIRSQKVGGRARRISESALRAFLAEGAQANDVVEAAAQALLDAERRSSLRGPSNTTPRSRTRVKAGTYGNE